MTSQINPNNIDGNYPVAGQANNTQGMRDNFTNTKTNFQYAVTEINDLQSKSVLKAALTGTTLDNNMNDSLLYAVKLQDVSYSATALTATSGAIEINYASNQYQSISTTGSVSLSFVNWPATGSAGVVYVSISVTSVAHTLTLPAAVTLGTTGIQGLSAGTITFTATGTYQFEFTSTTAGTTITVVDLTRPKLGSANSAIGYAAGAGGTITQITNKSTGVTLNKQCGQITMAAAALNAAAEVSFTLTNSSIAATDVVYVCVASGATAGAYSTEVDAVAAGSCRISVGNRNGSNLSEAIVLNFVVIKSVAA